MPRSRNRVPAACTSAARFSAAFSFVTFNGLPRSKRNELTSKIAVAIIAQRINCDCNECSFDFDSPQERCLTLGVEPYVEKKFEVFRRHPPRGACRLCCLAEPRYGRVPAP